MKRKQDTIIDVNFRSMDMNSTAHKNPLARKQDQTLIPPEQGRDALGSNMINSIGAIVENDSQLTRQNKGILKRLFGQASAQERRLAEHDFKKTDQVCTFLEKKLALECEALYLRCQDDTNNWLARHRIESRADLIEFATAQLQSLRDTIEQRRAEYTIYVRRRCERMNENADLELLFDAEARAMQTELDQHINFLQSLEDHFRQAILERIG